MRLNYAVSIPWIFLILRIVIDTVDNLLQIMSLYDFELEDLSGNKVSLNKYKGKPLLLLNVATL